MIGKIKFVARKNFFFSIFFYSPCVGVTSAYVNGLVTVITVTVGTCDSGPALLSFADQSTLKDSRE